MKKENKKKIEKTKLNEEKLDDILDDNRKIDEEFTNVDTRHSFKIIKNLFIIFILLAIFVRFYGVSQIVTKEYSIISKEIPRGFDGMKIVQISDIHYGTTINESNLKKMVNKVNQLKPDIIVFTGDLVAKGINPTDKIKAEITVNLSKLKAPIGKYAIASNEDLESDSFYDLITNSGFTLLNNEAKLIYNNDDEPIELVGIININNKIELTDNYKIALIHKPDDFDNIKNDNYNIVMAGHNHGGIIRLPFLGELINIEGAKKYHNDYYEIDNTKLYVSSGLGTSNINFRMFNQPSINLYRFYKD